jgi:hypothetical protein
LDFVCMMDTHYSARRDETFGNLNQNLIMLCTISNHFGYVNMYLGS